MSAALLVQRRALLLSVSKHYGGTDVRVEQLARGLEAAERPYCVAVLDGSELHRRLASDGLRVAPLTSGRGSPALARDIRRLSVGGNVVIDAHQVQSQFWMLMARSMLGRVPLLVTVHSDYTSEQKGRGLREHIYPRVPRLATRMGAGCIAVSESVRESLLATGIPESRIRLIPNGITDPGPVDRYRFDGWPEDAFVVCGVGRLEHVKGFDLLIDAVAMVADDLPRLRVAIAGDGRDREDLERKIVAHGLSERIRLLGFRDDMPRVMAASDALCMPSRTEGLPYALLEAGIAGLRIVATRVGGLERLLEHRATAYLTDPESAASVADGLRWAATEEARRAAETFSAYVRTDFSVEQMINRTFEVYDRHLPGRAIF